MTVRKTREIKVRATEDAVFGYRSPSAGSRMMSGSDEPEEDTDNDLLTDDSSPERVVYLDPHALKITIGELRKVISDEISNAFAQRNKR